MQAVIVATLFHVFIFICINIASVFKPLSSYLWCYIFKFSINWFFVKMIDEFFLFRHGIIVCS